METVISIACFLCAGALLLWTLLRGRHAHPQDKTRVSRLTHAIAWVKINGLRFDWVSWRHPPRREDGG